MFTVINILPIIKKHFQTLKKDSSPLALITLYIILPSVVSFMLVHKRLTLDQDLIRTLITAFSIFVGFIINVILIIFDIIKRNNKRREKVHEDLIVHLYYNSLYALTISIILLIFLLFVYFTYTKLNSSHICVLSAIFYFILTNFLLTLLQITRRIFVLLDQEIKQNSLSQ